MLGPPNFFKPLIDVTTDVGHRGPQYMGAQYSSRDSRVLEGSARKMLGLNSLPVSRADPLLLRRQHFLKAREQQLRTLVSPHPQLMRRPGPEVASARFDIGPRHRQFGYMSCTPLNKYDIAITYLPFFILVRTVNVKDGLK